MNTQELLYKEKVLLRLMEHFALALDTSWLSPWHDCSYERYHSKIECWMSIKDESSFADFYQTKRYIDWHRGYHNTKSDFEKISLAKIIGIGNEHCMYFRKENDQMENIGNTEKVILFCL